MAPVVWATLVSLVLRIKAMKYHLKVKMMVMVISTRKEWEWEWETWVGMEVGLRVGMEGG